MDHVREGRRVFHHKSDATVPDDSQTQALEHLRKEINTYKPLEVEFDTNFNFFKLPSDNRLEEDIVSTAVTYLNNNYLGV